MTELNLKNIENTNEFLKMIPDISGRNLFIEVHRLFSLPPAAMNCDGNGDIKKTTYGGYERAFISSASIKRALKMRFGDETHNTKSGPVIVMQKVKEILPEMSADYYETLLTVLYLAFGAKAKKTANSLKTAVYHASVKKTNYKTKQLLPISPESCELIAEKATKIFDEENCKKSILFKKWEDAKAKNGDLVLTDDGVKYATELTKAVNKCITKEEVKLGLGIALFGGMSTSPLLASVNNATQFSYGIGVNENAGDIDFFTAVDTFGGNLSVFDEDDSDDDETEADDNKSATGAGHLGTRDIAADCVYFYNNFDLRTLIENSLKGCDWKDTQEVKLRLEAMVEYLIQVLDANLRILPNGKRNSMFGWVEPDVVYLTCTKTLPQSLQNLYESPVRSKSSDSVSKIAVERLAKKIDTPPVFRTEYTKQYWLSYKYPDCVKNEDVKNSNEVDMLRELKEYLYEQLGINS